MRKLSMGVLGSTVQYGHISCRCQSRRTDAYGADSGAAITHREKSWEPVAEVRNSPGA